MHIVATWKWYHITNNIVRMILICKHTWGNNSEKKAMFKLLSDDPFKEKAVI